MTPFLRKHEFSPMSEIGWSTRSLEQPYPYTMDYKGKISPKELQEAFFLTLHDVQTGKFLSEKLIRYIFKE